MPAVVAASGDEGGSPPRLALWGSGGGKSRCNPASEESAEAIAVRIRGKNTAFGFPISGDTRSQRGTRKAAPRPCSPSRASGSNEGRPESRRAGIEGRNRRRKTAPSFAPRRSRLYYYVTASLHHYATALLRPSVPQSLRYPGPVVSYNRAGTQALLPSPSPPQHVQLTIVLLGHPGVVPAG